MKTETKAIIASIAVIALMLTSVSGATYSWFTDIDESTVEVTVGTVRYDTVFSLDDEIINGSVGIDDFGPGKTHTIAVTIQNHSSIATKYSAYIEYRGSHLNDYDMANIYVVEDLLGKDTKKTYLSEYDAKSPGKIILESREQPKPSPSPAIWGFVLSIGAAETYGSYTDDRSGYKLPDGNKISLGEWNAGEDRSLTLKLVVEAYQYDYEPDENGDASPDLSKGIKIKSDTISGTLSVDRDGQNAVVPIVIDNLNRYNGETITASLSYGEYKFNEVQYCLTINITNVTSGTIRVDVTLPEMVETAFYFSQPGGPISGDISITPMDAGCFISIDMDMAMDKSVVYAINHNYFGSIA